MKVQRIKIFYAECYEELESYVNDWLALRKNEIEVKTISFEATCALVFYLEENNNGR